MGFVLNGCAVCVCDFWLQTSATVGIGCFKSWASTSNPLLQIRYFKSVTSNPLLQIRYFKSVTSNPLLQILDALLAGNSFLWTLPGAGIGAGALTTHGQAAAMPQTAVATNILKA